MVLLNSLESNKSYTASPFNLISVDGKHYNLESIRGKNGTVVAFICNHCPYVKAIVSEMVREAAMLRKIGVSFVAINPNAHPSYPEDSYDNMKIFAKENMFDFPYLLDDPQEIAKQYGAVCTPDFFGFNDKLLLQYRGRLNDITVKRHKQDEDSKQQNDEQAVVRELFLAMSHIAVHGTYSGTETPTMGCSIKWKEKEGK